MRQAFKTLGLLLLLMAAQQGAVVHELSHVVDAAHVGLRVQSDVGTVELSTARPRAVLGRLPFGRCDVQFTYKAAADHPNSSAIARMSAVGDP